LFDNYKGGRFNRPNDVVCHSNGCLYFTDPDKRRPYHEREIPGPAGEGNLWDGARVYRLAPASGLSVLANCEYPNGLARSPDERTMYVANTRSSQYIHAIRLDAAGNMVGRSIFADLNEGSELGIPDGLKVDSIGRVYCTGPGGIWVMAPDGRRIGVIRWPEQAVNFAFGALIESAKLNGLNPQHYLADVLARIADHPARRIAELLPWNWQPRDVTRAAA
jgi:gluconolactonase